jgi:hypothetical protein
MTPSPLEKRVIVKFTTNENVKRAKILKRLIAQFGEKRSQGSRCTTGVSHLNDAEQRLKPCEEYTFCRNSYGQRFWDTQGVLFIDFLIEQRTINAAYYSKLLKDRVKPAFSSKRRGRTVKGVYLVHNSRPHTDWTKCIGRYCHTPLIALT